MGNAIGGNRIKKSSKTSKTSKNIKLSDSAKYAIKLKLKKSPKVANSFTVIEGWYKPSTFLRFSYKGPVLYVSISKKQTIYRGGKHVSESKYLGKFKAIDLL